MTLRALQQLYPSLAIHQDMMDKYGDFEILESNWQLEDGKLIYDFAKTEDGTQSSLFEMD